MSVKPSIESVPGFSVAAVKAGIKASGKLDMGLIVADRPVPTAGVFTKNRIVSPSVRLDKANLKATGGLARAILVNAGNANTCTGRRGYTDAKDSAADVALGIGSEPAEVLVCSTGVIGHHLPMERMHAGIARLIKGLGRSRGFARAIMTTDLVRKVAGARTAGGITVAGVCKGSGMIAPNMATMLGFILTDAKVAPAVLKTALSEVVEQTFNCVTVDGDCSTNDSVLLMASGLAGRSITRASGRNYRMFWDALLDVSMSLAEQIAADGEGATKLVRVTVRNARSDSDARKMARTIAESPLVKTAMFGNDPNWGRILMAAGRSGAALKENKALVRLCGVTMFANGAPARFSASKLSKAMKAKDVEIIVDLGLGKASCQMLTCDFSYDYVKINAEYHT